MFFSGSVSFFPCILSSPSAQLKVPSPSDLETKNNQSLQQRNFNWQTILYDYCWTNKDAQIFWLCVHLMVVLRLVYLWDLLTMFSVKRASLRVSSWYLCRSWVSRLRSALSACSWNTSCSDWIRRSVRSAWSFWGSKTHKLFESLGDAETERQHLQPFPLGIQGPGLDFD